MIKNFTITTPKPIENQAIKLADNLMASVIAALHPVWKAVILLQLFEPSAQQDAGVPASPQSNGPVLPQH